ncbi:unnamed protein product [Paramecium sonneborni]|uniref:Beta-lactamase-related domain-containing protein n=1 Tax=Paramecium sonneborni TaxID=65129 RepID=A0A8S1MZQ3_9CILI|nr:unnamed protein product [Paramecium sonneborni]
MKQKGQQKKKVITREILLEQLKQNLQMMNHKMSFLVQGADGEIFIKEHLCEQGKQPYDDNTRIHIASGCKWIAMATIMKVVELGLVNVNTKVIDIYPEFRNTNPNLILKHLITHTSGYELADEWILDLDISLQESVIGIAKGGKYPASKVHFQGGTKVGYSDIGMQIAGGMAEKITGKSFHQLFNEFIAIPLEMKNAEFTAFDGQKGQNIAIADGFLIRMIDYANFMRMILNYGTFNGKQILKISTVKQMLQDYTSDLPVSKKIMKEVVGDVSDFYGFGIGAWIYDTNQNNQPVIFSSSGIHGFSNWIDIENQYLCIFYIRTEVENEPLISELTESMRPQILEFVLKETEKLKQKLVNV